MITAGIDSGNSTTKAVILLEDGRIFSGIVSSIGEANAMAAEALQQAIALAGIEKEAINYLVVSGAGGKDIKTTNDYVSAISCAVKGLHYLLPSVRTLVDIGAEGFLVAKGDEQGNLVDYDQHQKCGSGGGLFLELAADALEVDLSEMGEISKKTTNKLEITATCAVFAESEIVSFIHQGAHKADILDAVHRSISGRVGSLLSAIEIEKDLALIGGVARNVGLVDNLKSSLGMDLLVPENPEFVVALGAAHIARELLEKKGKFKIKKEKPVYQAEFGCAGCAAQAVGEGGRR